MRERPPEVICDIEDGVATLCLAAPPLNLVSPALRAALAEALDRLAGQRGLRGVILRGGGGQFSAGTDLAAGPDPDAPDLAALCARIEGFRLPVIAALEGEVSGAGLELALAAHDRIAHERARLSMPCLGFALLPEGGATQRLPRLVGAGPALDLLLTGSALSAPRALSMGLLDGVTEGDPAEAARARLATLVATRRGPRPTMQREDGFAEPGAYWSALRSRRDGLARRFSGDQLAAARALVRCVEAAQMLPAAQGLDLERTLAAEAAERPEPAARIHAFLAERRAARLPPEMAGLASDLAAVPRLAVVAGPRSGPDLALALARSGLPVLLVARSSGAAQAARARVTATLDAEVAEGRTPATGRAVILERMVTGTDMAALAGADLIFEDVEEDFDMKSEALWKIGQVAAPGALIASTTAMFDVDALAQKTGRPETTLAITVTRQPDRFPLSEVIAGPDTTPGAEATAVALMRRARRWPVRAANVEGGLFERLRRAWLDAADLLLEDGANPAEIDSALADAGYAEGPCRMQDHDGLIRDHRRRQRAAAERDPFERYVDLADRLVARGWTGQEAGQGFYRYPERGGVAMDCPEVAALIDEMREENRLAPRPIEPDEIVFTCLLALINEGARLLGDGVAADPAEIDAVAVNGLGFPRGLGGPLYQTDRIGLAQVAAALETRVPDAPTLWTPAALILRLAEEGGRFADLHAPSADASRPEATEEEGEAEDPVPGPETVSPDLSPEEPRSPPS
jgi:3-hydroxyacyl-CoA dehydrogenase